MPVHYKWSTRKKEGCKQSCPSFEVTNHPLKINILIKPNSSKSFIENLNKWSSVIEEVDPLLRFEHLGLEDDMCPTEISYGNTNYYKAWSTKRAVILNKYTTGEKLTIVSSYLPGEEKALIRQVSNLNEKVKNRLEQLDDFEEGSVKKTMGLSQQEFVTKIHMLNDEIKKAWDSEQRVKAFKIAIQCSKLLSDVSVMPFYPSKFVLITDILDNFGNLVYDRLKEKSFGTTEVKTVQEIDPETIPESAKETCQNWMFKMASIRELLPRLYMEMTLLRCYSFISKGEIKPTITRLIKMIRGIGNPLVAVYLRLYLCNVSSNLLGTDSEQYFYSNFKEFLEEYQQIYHPMMTKKYEAQLLTHDRYLNLYVPAVDWLLYGTLNGSRCKLTLLEECLQQCEQMENNELLLCCIISSFDSVNVIKKSSFILEMIQNNANKMVLLNEVLAALGEHLCKADSYRQVNAEALIQIWWKITSNMKTTSHFLQVLEPWIQFACTHLSTQHVNIILRGTIRYMVKCGSPIDEFSNKFLFVVKRMLKSIPEVEELFLMDAFMPLVDLIQTSSTRTLIAKTVLSMFFSRYDSVLIEDHIIISGLMRLCCILHDSINAVTVDDEIKVCAELINKFVQVVTYQDDVEQQLNFYVECRSAFIKLDAVLETLVHAAAASGARAGGRTNGVAGHARRAGGADESRWARRAAAAYCFITVPSLAGALRRARLYLLGGQGALLGGCVGQAEANFKALIGLIPDIPEYILEDSLKIPTSVKVQGLISDFLSTLLVLPDNVDSNCKVYILSGFIKTMEVIHWKKTEPLYYTTLLHILDLLCEMTQETYAYHIDGVLSNDKLYGCATEFIEILENYATNICQELLVVLKTLGDLKETKKQHNLTLELFWRVIRRGALQESSMLNLAANLWMLSNKIQENSKFAMSMLSALEKDSEPACQVLLQKLKV